MFLNVIVIVSPLKPTSSVFRRRKAHLLWFCGENDHSHFPHYTIRRDNEEVFCLLLERKKLRQIIMEKIRIFCESGEGK